MTKKTFSSTPTKFVIKNNSKSWKLNRVVYLARFEQETRRQEVVPTIIPLMISYEELYNGSLKRIGIIVKRRNQATGDYYMVTKVITINVDPRWRTGERIIRENAGDELEDGTYNTLVFEIQERPHYLFTRVEDNLRINVCISIPEAAIGFKRYYNLLDERILDIEKGGQLTFSDKEHRIRGEGMVNPVTGNRGDLIVRFEVMRAVYFTAEQTQ